MPAASASGSIGAADFSLYVMPESFAPGGSAQISHAVRVAEGEVLLELHAAEAVGLKAVHVQLGYDPARLTPLAAQATGTLSAAGAGFSDEDLLELNILSFPGTVYHSQVLTYHPQRAGFTGSTLLATVRFSLRPFEAPQGLAAESRRPAAVPAGFNPVAEHMSRLPIEWNAAAGTVEVFYDFPGDYDQNGEVNGADAAPVAQYFGEKLESLSQDPNARKEYDTARSVADGDLNGEINAADLVTLAANFRRKFDHTDVYRTTDLNTAYPLVGVGTVGLEPWQSADLADFTGQLGADRLRLVLPAGGDLTGRVLWAEAVGQDGQSAEATRMLVCRTDPEAAPLLPVLYEPNHLLSYNDQTDELSWYHFLHGDNDDNGEINANDVSGIGAHLLTDTSQADPATDVWQIDSWRDGVIDMLDFYPIMLNFRVWVTEYHVFTAPDPGAVLDNPYAAETHTAVAVVPLSEFLLSSARRSATLTLDIPSGHYVWVRPGRDGMLGTRSEIIQAP